MNAYRIKYYAAGLLLSLLCWRPTYSLAAQWPDRPIFLVAPFAAGGMLDLVGRVVAKALGEQLHQSIVIENRPGAGGIIGSTHVAHSAPDGYTFLIGSNGTIINSLIQKLPYKDDQLTPVALLSITSSVIVTNPSNPATDLASFVKNAKAKKLTRIAFSTSGIGSTPDLVSDMMERATGLPIQVIPYKSGLESVTSVVSGQTDITSEAPIVTLPLIRGGKLKALATTLDQRISATPPIPTTKEEGFPSIFIGHWTGVFAPTGTPTDILDKMNAAIQAALKDPKVIRTFEQNSISAGTGSRMQFSEFAAKERQRLADILKTAPKASK